MIEEENEELRVKLHGQRRVNGKLTADNHQLLNQVEELSHQHRQCKTQVVQLLGQLEEHDTVVREMRQALSGREDEVDKLNSALQKTHTDMRELAGRSSSMANELEDQLQKNIEATELIHALKSDLVAAKKLKERAEGECQRSLEAAEAMQMSVEEYRRKNAGKYQQQEQTEAELREELHNTQQQQKVLQKRIQDATAHIADLTEEVRRFEAENSSEREARMSADQQNIELRVQVSKLSAMISKKTSRAPANSDHERRNVELERQVMQLQHALEVSNQSTSQAEAYPRHCLSSQTNDPSDSGIGWAESSSTVVQELREKLSEQEQEIRVLRSRLENREAYDQDALDTSLRKTKASKDKLEHQVEELQLLLSSLEEERGRHTSRLLLLEEQKTDLELRQSTLSAKLEHKSQQADGLQVELKDLNTHTVTMDRQLRKARSEIELIQQQLEDTSEKKKQLESFVKNLQKQLKETTEEVAHLQTETQKLRSSLHAAESSEREQKQRDKANFDEAQATIAQLSAELEQRDEEMQRTLTDMDKVSQDLNAKEMAVIDMQQDLKAAHIENQRTLKCVENKAAQAVSQVHDLQAALAICKQELQVHIEQFDESKEELRKELDHKSQIVCELEHEQLTLRETLVERDLSIVDLQQQLKNSQDLTQNTSEKFLQMERTNETLRAEIATLQHDQLQDKANFDKAKCFLEQELKSSQDKLETASGTISLNDEELQAKNTQIQNLQHDLVAAEQDADDIRSQLEDVQNETIQLESQISQMDQQLSDTKTELRNHKNQVDGLEVEVERLRDELEEKTTTSAELRTQLHNKTQRVTQLQTEQESSRGQQQTDNEERRKLEQTVLEQERKYTSLNNRFSAQQESLQQKQSEIEQLYGTLQQQQYQIQQRSNQVTQLDLIMKEHKNETEQRLTTLEAALNKSQLEAQQRSKQVTTLDEQVGLLKSDLREKELLLEESHKTCSRQQLQLHSCSDNITALQQQIQELKTQLLNVKAENEELQKELDVTRDEEKRLQHELTEAQCEASLHLRQGERINTQLQEALQQGQAQEGNAACLAEALELLNAQKVQLESRHEAAKRQLQRDVDEIRTNYQHQLDNLRRETSEVADRLEREQDELRHELSAAKQTEHLLTLELESTRAELSHSTGLSSIKQPTVKHLVQPKINDAAKEHFKPPLHLQTNSSSLPANMTKTAKAASNIMDKLKSSTQPHVSDNDETPVSQSQAVQSGNFQVKDKIKSDFKSEAESRNFDGSVGAVGTRQAQQLSTTETEASGLPTQLMSLSISDISRAESSEAHYVISEPDDPDSLQSMLREVQRICSQNVSAASGRHVKAATGTGDRFFGPKAWPHGQNTKSNISSNASKGTGKYSGKPTSKLPMGKKANQMEELRRHKGPLHSSPHSRKTKSVLGANKSHNGKKIVRIKENESDIGANALYDDNKPTRDTNKSKLKAKQSPLLPDQSPNVSTAIAHYQGDEEGLAVRLFQEDGDSDEHGAAGQNPDRNKEYMTITEQQVVEADEQQQAVIKGNKPDGDLSERRKALAAMQRELETQLQAVDQHLAANTQLP